MTFFIREQDGSQALEGALCVPGGEGKGTEIHTGAEMHAPPASMDSEETLSKLLTVETEGQGPFASSPGLGCSLQLFLGK